MLCSLLSNSWLNRHYSISKTLKRIKIHLLLKLNLSFASSACQNTHCIQNTAWLAGASSGWIWVHVALRCISSNPASVGNVRDWKRWWSMFRPVPLTEHKEGRRLEVLGTSWNECFHNEFQFTWMKRWWLSLIGLYNQQQQQQKPDRTLSLWLLEWLKGCYNHVILMWKMDHLCSVQALSYGL